MTFSSDKFTPYSASCFGTEMQKLFGPTKDSLEPIMAAIYGSRYADVFSRMPNALLTIQEMFIKSHLVSFKKKSPLLIESINDVYQLTTVRQFAIPTHFPTLHVNMGNYSVINSYDPIRKRFDPNYDEPKANKEKYQVSDYSRLYQPAANEYNDVFVVGNRFGKWSALRTLMAFYRKYDNEVLEWRFNTMRKYFDIAKAAGLSIDSPYLELVNYCKEKILESGYDLSSWSTEWPEGKKAKLLDMFRFILISNKYDGPMGLMYQNSNPSTEYAVYKFLDKLPTSNNTYKIITSPTKDEFTNLAKICVMYSSNSEGSSESVAVPILSKEGAYKLCNHLWSVMVGPGYLPTCYKEEGYQNYINSFKLNSNIEDLDEYLLREMLSYDSGTYKDLFYKLQQLRGLVKPEEYLTKGTIVLRSLKKYQEIKYTNEALVHLVKSDLQIQAAYEEEYLGKDCWQIIEEINALSDYDKNLTHYEFGYDNGSTKEEMDENFRMAIEVIRARVAEVIPQDRYKFVKKQLEEQDIAKAEAEAQAKLDQYYVRKYYDDYLDYRLEINPPQAPLEFVEWINMMHEEGKLNS